MEHDENPQYEPLEIRTFVPEQIELIDPNHQPPVRPHPVRRRKRLAIILFLATGASMFLAGMVPPAGLEGLLVPQIRNNFTPAELFTNGLTFSASLMLILFCHEMGHYLQARRYHVPASLPYFIPMPISPFGTFGAVIVQEAGVADRKSMFDIAISGPLAGLVIALPVTYYGLLDARIEPGLPVFGDPLILQWMTEYVRGPLTENHMVRFNPLLFAGWVGIFITALNLIPIGQLDGGHILYSLLGRRAHMVAVALLWGAIGYMMVTGNFTYIFIVILLLLFGPKHPPTADDSIPLGIGRTVLGWLTLAFIFIGFTPTPIVSPKDNRPEAPARGQRQEITQNSLAAELAPRVASASTRRASPAAKRRTSHRLAATRREARSGNSAAQFSNVWKPIQFE